MFERAFDESTGVIRVKATGQWDEAALEDHLAQMIMLVMNVRHQGFPVRVLVDIRQSDRQDAAIDNAFAEFKSIMYRAGDRVAILTKDRDDRDHIRSHCDGGEIWSWQSEIAAEQWLQLDGHLALPMRRAG